MDYCRDWFCLFVQRLFAQRSERIAACWFLVGTMRAAKSILVHTPLIFYYLFSLGWHRHGLHFVFG